MSIQAKLFEDMKAAMKAGEKLRLGTIRLLRAQLKNREIEEGSPLTDEQEIQILMNAAKKRKEAIQQFRELNRDDRADEEQEELNVISQYLPKQMSREEIAQLITDTIGEVHANSLQDIGKVMGRIMAQVKGKADGKLVQTIVREKLSSL